MEFSALRSATASEKLPRDAELCVIGCGPTGVAALFEAACTGIVAVGVEAGAKPLASLEDHLVGLTYLSPSAHFELPGLPLDCRDPCECTREEVIRYYNRLIDYAKLAIHSSCRCIGLRPHRSWVDVLCDVNGRLEVIRARDVIATNWFERRHVSQRVRLSQTRVVVMNHLRSPADVAGQRAVVFGGGVSGLEYACALMLAGQSVTLLMRGKRKAIHTRRQFERLLAATGSVIVEQVSRVHVESNGLRFSARSIERELLCDVLIVAWGARLNPAWLRILVTAGVLDQPTVRGLRAAESLEQVGRARPGLNVFEREELAISRRPDLFEHLFHGRRRVRLAGGVLHVGASDAGIAVSIATAILAVRAVAGESPPTSCERPLARWLSDLPRLAEAVQRSAARMVGVHFRPFAGTDGCSPRTLVPFLAESALGGETVSANAAARNRQTLLNGFDRTDHQMAQELIARCDGENSLLDLLREAACSGRTTRPRVLEVLRFLLTHDLLTLLPPSCPIPDLIASDLTPLNAISGVPREA